MLLDLRPLTLAELLDRAIGLYRRHLWLFVGIMAVPSVFSLALNVFAEMMQRIADVPGAPETAGAAQIPAMLIAAGAGFVIIITAYLVAYMVALGATTLAVSEIYLGRIVTVSDVYARMRGRIGRLVILMLLMAVRIGVLSLGSIVVMAGIAGAAFAALPTVAGTIVSGLAVILGVIIGGAFFMFMVLRWGVAAPALVLEDLNARAAIKRSIEMTRGRKGRVFLLGVCTVVITYAVLLLVQVPFIMAAGMVGVETTAGFWLTIAGAVLGTIGTTFTGPLLIIGQALLYYDARIRDEGLDLQLMMAAIEGPVQVSDVARG